MLSLFPQILFLAPFSALLIRIAAAVVFGYDAWNRFSRKPAPWVMVVVVLEIVVAIMLLVGFYTQAAALVGAITLGLLFYVNFADEKINVIREITWWLMLILLFSLMVTGPGPFAFDLPL